MSRLPQRCVIGSNFFRKLYLLYQQGDSQKLNKNYLEQIRERVISLTNRKKATQTERTWQTPHRKALNGDLTQDLPSVCLNALMSTTANLAKLLN